MLIRTDCVFDLFSRLTPRTVLEVARFAAEARATITGRVG